MFEIIERFNNSGSFTDIKLALIRFISEFLIQTAHHKSNFLDEVVILNCEQHRDQDPGYDYGA